MTRTPPQLRSPPFAALMAALVLSVSGCQVEYDPPSLINKLRVLGVRAEPPQIWTDRPTELSALVVGTEKDAELCYAWAFCFFVMPGEYKCFDPDLQIPLGTAPTAQTSAADFFATFLKAPAVMKKHGEQMPATVDTQDCDAPELTDEERGECKDKQARAMALLQVNVLFKIATAAEFGGTCPTDAAKMLATVCKDRSRCLAGYKRLALAMTPKYRHSNPRFERIELAGVTWPEGVTPVVLPYEEKGDAFDQILESGVNAELWEGYGPTALEITPKLDAASNEVTPEVLDLDGNVSKESLLMSWFSDAGKYKKNRSYDDVPENLFLAPEPEKGVPERTVSLWIVLRDGRNGTTWTQRRVTVRADAERDGNPLCRVDGTLKGCKTAAP